MEIVITKTADGLNFGEIVKLHHRYSTKGITMGGRITKVTKGHYRFCKEMYDYSKKPVVVNPYINI
jgi:hypothetical protein